jgi:predicted membrane protein
MIWRAVSFVLTLLVVFGLSLLLVPAFAILIGVLNKVILNVV